jgi:hypothetical protein
MPITVSQLREKNQPLSPEEQEELAHKANAARRHVLSYFTQQFQETNNRVLSIFKQHIQEAIKPSFSELFGQKGYFTGLIQETFGARERYTEPAYIPPPLYLEQSPPQIVYIYIYDLPGLN